MSDNTSNMRKQVRKNAEADAARLLLGISQGEINYHSTGLEAHEVYAGVTGHRSLVFEFNGCEYDFDSPYPGMDEDVLIELLIRTKDMLEQRVLEVCDCG